LLPSPSSTSTLDGLTEVVRLKTKYTLPFFVEQRLVQKFGFAVESRVFGDGITFVKRERKPAEKPRLKTIYYPSLTDAEQKALLKRCELIVDFYPKPYEARKAIRQRLINLAEVMVEKAKYQYIMDFMEEFFPEEVKI